MRLSATLSLVGIALAISTSRAQAPAPSGIVTLASLKDRFRVLLIFAPKPDDPQLEIQLRTLNEHAPAASERDLIPIALPYQSPSPTPTTLSPAEADRLRRSLAIPPADFTVILLGKDGGEKLRSSKPLTIDHLNAIIDAMPMRQDEMRSHTR